jgi:hypothetical protein
MGIVMGDAPTRVDAENLKLLEQLRPKFERLKVERIRAESEIERLTLELEEARRLARQELGTDDEDGIRRMIDAARTRNTAMVEEFAALVHEIDARLARLLEEM